MDISNLPSWIWVVAVSEAIAILVMLKVWRSAESYGFKVALTIIATIPVLGPVAALWIHGFPESQPAALQDRNRYHADVHDRWREVLDEKNPVRRFSKWKEAMKREGSE